MKDINKKISKLLTKAVCSLSGHSYEEQFFEPNYYSPYNKLLGKQSLGHFCSRCGKRKPNGK